MISNSLESSERSKQLSLAAVTVLLLSLLLLSLLLLQKLFVTVAAVAFENVAESKKERATTAATVTATDTKRQTLQGLSHVTVELSKTPTTHQFPGIWVTVSLLLFLSLVDRIVIVM
jgi:hypothetical protein